MRIERRAEWYDDINDWMIPNLEYTGNHIKQQKAKMKETGQGQYNFLKEKVLSLDENSEDEDYEAAATKRVQEAVQSILQEEEEEMGIQAAAYVPPEKMSVFFRYTDDGAVREDPEDAAKKEKQKKKRLQSAKRPLTAKKKKADMMTGDIEKMVETMGAQQKANQQSGVEKKKIYPKAKGNIV